MFSIVPTPLTRLLLVLAVSVFALIPHTGRAEEAKPGAVNPHPVNDDPAAVKAAPVAEPDDYRTEEYRKPVPATLKGAKVLSPEQASEIWTKNAAVFIDVYPKAPKPDNLPAGTFWREPTHQSIENAKWVPNVGYGPLGAPIEDYFKRQLTALSGGDNAKPLVFFCLRNCWMSWNAAKRAMTYGYSNVMWFPEGTDAWQEIGQSVVEAKPEP